MESRYHRTRISILAFLLLLPLAPLHSQELGPYDIDPKTEDTRCLEMNYRHKTALELERMTPEQLIDESEKHWNYHVGLMDQYGMFTLPSYTDKIGIAIIPVLADLAAEFRVRTRSKCQEQRFFTAFAIASDVDDQVIRLRTIKEAQAAILISADALKQMKNAGLADQIIDPKTKYPREYSMYPFGLLLLS